MLLASNGVLTKSVFFENSLMDTSITIPAAIGSTVNTRLSKYTACLHMVKIVLDRELETSMSRELFENIGSVACFIDEQLDSLSVSQQEQMLHHFDDLYAALWYSSETFGFNKIILQFNRTHNIGCTCIPESLTALYTFMAYCKERNLYEELHSFGRQIIACSLSKRACTTTRAIVQNLKSEGIAVVSLLRNILHSEYGSYSKFDLTVDYLKSLEHILNLGDDTLDAHKDAKNGILNTQLSSLHPIKILGYLVAHICKTIIKHPIKTAYFAPVLTSYYFRNK